MRQTPYIQVRLRPTFAIFLAIGCLCWRACAETDLNEGVLAAPVGSWDDCSDEADVSSMSSSQIQCCQAKKEWLRIQAIGGCGSGGTPESECSPLEARCVECNDASSEVIAYFNSTAGYNATLPRGAVALTTTSQLLRSYLDPSALSARCTLPRVQQSCGTSLAGLGLGLVLTLGLAVLAIAFLLVGVFDKYMLPLLQERLSSSLMQRSTSKTQGCTDTTSKGVSSETGSFTSTAASTGSSSKNISNNSSSSISSSSSSKQASHLTLSSAAEACGPSPPSTVMAHCRHHPPQPPSPTSTSPRASAAAAVARGRSGSSNNGGSSNSYSITNNNNSSNNTKTAVAPSSARRLQGRGPTGMEAPSNGLRAAGCASADRPDFSPSMKDYRSARGTATAEEQKHDQEQENKEEHEDQKEQKHEENKEDDRSWPPRLARVWGHRAAFLRVAVFSAVIRLAVIGLRSVGTSNSLLDDDDGVLQTWDGVLPATTVIEHAAFVVLPELLMVILPLVWVALTSRPPTDPKGGLPAGVARVRPGRLPRFTTFAALVFALELVCVWFTGLSLSQSGCDEEDQWRLLVPYCSGILAVVLRCYSGLLAVQLQDDVNRACRRVLPMTYLQTDPQKSLPTHRNIIGAAAAVGDFTDLAELAAACQLESAPRRPRRFIDLDDDDDVDFLGDDYVDGGVVVGGGSGGDRGGLRGGGGGGSGGGWVGNSNDDGDIEILEERSMVSADVEANRHASPPRPLREGWGPPPRPPPKSPVAETSLDGAAASSASRRARSRRFWRGLVGLCCCLPSREEESFNSNDSLTLIEPFDDSVLAEPVGAGGKERCCCRRHLVRMRILVRCSFVLIVFWSAAAVIIGRVLSNEETTPELASSCVTAQNGTATCQAFKIIGMDPLTGTALGSDGEPVTTQEGCCSGCDGVSECHGWIFEGIRRRCSWIRFEKEPCKSNPGELGCRCLTHYGTNFGFKPTSELIWVNSGS